MISEENQAKLISSKNVHGIKQIKWEGLVGMYV